MDMSEKRRRLASWIRGDGIEIGGLHRPLDVPDGARVRYVDLHTTEELKEKFPELGDVPLVPVSIISGATDLASIGDGEVDFVIANHLIEHLESPISGLLEWHRVLRPGGILYMAVPDARASFDRARPLTTVEHLIEEFRNGVEQNRADHYREFITLAESQPEVVSWPGPSGDVDTRLEFMMRTQHSVHFHVWRPDTFLEFLAAAQREAGFAFDVVAVAAWEPGFDDEFLVVLSKGNAAPPAPPSTPWGAALPSTSVASDSAAPDAVAQSDATEEPAPAGPATLSARGRAWLARGRTGRLLRPIRHRLVAARRRVGALRQRP